MVCLREVNLILPVYKGGDLLSGAIESIENSRLKFSNVFISFNGADPADYESFKNYSSKNLLNYTYTTFRTLTNLTASEHFAFIVEHIQKCISKNSMIMLLAHDDRIFYEDSILQQRNYFSELRDDTVYFPSYEFCSAGEYNVVTKRVSLQEHLTVSDFFWRTMRDNLYTNMSGMIMPYQALIEGLQQEASIGTGARAEHMRCLSKNIRYVHFTKKVRALIGERVDSDGQCVSPVKHRRAALAYVMLYKSNGHLARSGQYLPYAYELLKKIVAYALECARRGVGFNF